MPALLEDEIEPVGDLGSHVAPRHSTLGQPGPHVEPRHHARRALDPADRLPHAGSERAEQLRLPGAHLLLGAEDPGLVLLELGVT